MPSRLYRFDGARWVKVEDNVRTNITPGALGGNTETEKQQTQRDSYVNNTNTYTDATGVTHNERQALSKALTPKADN